MLLWDHLCDHSYGNSKNRDRKLRQNTSASLMWRFGRLSFFCCAIGPGVEGIHLGRCWDWKWKVTTVVYSWYTHWNIFAYHSEDLDQIWQLFRLIGAHLLHGPPEISLTRNPRDQSQAESMAAISALIWDMGLHRRWDETGETGEV